MRPPPRQILSALAPAVLLALWLGLVGLVLWLVQGRALLDQLAVHGALIFGLWALAGFALGWWAWGFYDRHIAAVARLVTGTSLLAGDSLSPLLPVTGGTAALAQAINQLADSSRDLQADMQRKIDEASRKVAQERDQLGALMAELQQSVVVCTLDGRILLYNGRARGLFQRLSASPSIAGGAELIGLGRSIHAVIDSGLITHALETVERRIARAETAVSARFVTSTPAGNLLQVILAPVRPDPDAAQLSGYVLLLDDITEEQASQSRRDRRLTDLTEASRASLANIQTALDMLDYPDLEDAERDSFQSVVRDEVNAMGARLAALSDDASRDVLTRWPLQDMQGADFLTAAAQRIMQQTGHQVELQTGAEAVWLRVDSFSLIQALAFLVTVLQPLKANLLQLRLAQADQGPEGDIHSPGASKGQWAHLDLIWAQTTLPLSAGWQNASITLDGSAANITAREVAERHGGEVWLEHDRQAGQSFFRFMLPLALGDHDQAALPERPEFYNFDLFASGDHSQSLDDQPLDSLALTVFDTETTGLDPNGGDEIIQMGAVRILNGKLLTGESFDQLVDPGRLIPEASIPFHGIRPEMVRGQPLIAEVLPTFHHFAQDTVLVGHNVAFDMRFLQLKEAATGLRFDQPVLDTLLLATVAQPHQESYQMEDIAARLGVRVQDRHSALGDALTTARIFIKLIPLLRHQGIVTLQQARNAAQQSYYARLKY